MALSGEQVPFIVAAGASALALASLLWALRVSDGARGAAKRFRERSGELEAALSEQQTILSAHPGVVLVWDGDAVRPGGTFGDELAMGGGGAAFRLRPNPHFALDIGGNIYAGNDYNGLDRWQAPFEVDALFFFNPQHRFQFYALVGVGASYGEASGFNIHTRQFDAREYFHLGGTAGLGVEWRISRVFALNFDVRGFIQQRVDDNPEPESTELNDDGRWQQTDTSGGFTGRFGMTFYWGR